MQQVISELQRVQSRTRFMLLLQRIAVVAAWTIAILLAVILFDFALRLPSAFRLVLLLAGLGALVFVIWSYVWPAMMFRPSLTQLALRVERIMPGVAGRLASSIEFAAAGMDQSNQLAARSVRETQTRLTGEAMASVISSKRTWRDLSIMVAVIALAAVAAIADPAAAATGLKRIFLPYGETKWPARTGVESLTNLHVYPRGTALPLRAGVTRGALEQRIDAHYRLRVNGSFQPWQRIVLTHQAGGNVHERLIDTNAEEVEFYFTSDDDQSSSQTIELVPPPAVRQASLTVTPPEYATAFVPVMRAELGQGLDNRAVTDTASLIGSTAKLRFELNKPLPTPESDSKRSEWLQSTFGWNDNGNPASDLPQFAVDPSNPAVWTLEWPIAGTRALALNLIDEHGLSNSDPIAYRIEAVEDRAPSVTITQPETDETVLASAVVALAAEARDDVAISSLDLQAHVQTGGKTAEESLTQNAAWEFTQKASQPAAVTQSELQLAPLHLAEGDIVLVSGVARDVFTSAADSQSNETVGDQASLAGHQTRSAIRRLRVIGETDMATQLRRQLSAVRQNAIRIEAQQSELQDDVAENGIPRGSGIDRAQAQIGERIAAQRASVQDIERLVRQNRLDDPQLGQILQQANDLLDTAGRAANKAVEAIEKNRDGEKSTSRNDGDRNATQQNKNADQQDAAESKPLAPGSAGGEQAATSQPSREDDNRAKASRAGESSKPESRDEASRAATPSKSEKSPGESNPKSQIQNPKLPEVTDAQQEVRDELTDLIKLLDRDEDTWVTKRQLENLLKDQQQLEQETTNLGNQTMGRRPEELSEQQRSELDKITQRQRDLRDEARKLIENLRNRSKAMQDVDPQSAEAMRKAADTAEREQLDQDMENAAQKAQQNQMTSATASQQSAQSTMQRMKEDIDNTRRAQAQQLIRALASLVESIQRLITVQENELNALALANDANNYSGLDRSMIRLNQNTQAVAGEARTAGQEARRVARSLDRAADTQGAAVTAFRAEPVNAAEAQASEERSLALLKEAKQLAEELQKKTQEEETRKRREELMNAYAKFAEQQIAVREETLPLSNLPQLDRRQLVEARRLSSSQDEIRTGLNQLRDTTSEILDSPIFVHVHRSIDGWSSEISDALVAGTVNVSITDRQHQIADSIGRLIKALQESAAPPDEFEKEQQQGGQNGSGQQGQQALIPPIAQLKLLQGLQEQVYNLTKELDSRADLDAAQQRQRLRDVGQQQRELMDLGKQMLEQLQRQQPKPKPAEGDGEKPQPAPDQPQEPAPQE